MLRLQLIVAAVDGHVSISVIDRVAMNDDLVSTQINHPSARPLQMRRDAA